jgi:hypothetical protein
MVFGALPPLVAGVGSNASDVLCRERWISENGVS